MNILEVEGLCKTYPAFQLRDVSFAVAPGTIMGFIGRNGAGKSTTIKSMLNLVHPYTVVFFYGLLGIFFTFLNGRENKDVYYCAVLPVTKRDQVRARTWLVVAVELAELVIAVPFAFLSARINPNGTNLAGIDANVALFGSVLLIYGVFNIVFLPVFYKTAIRVGRAFLLAVIPMTVLMALVEAMSHFPVVGPYLDATDAAGQVRQLPVLAVGLAVFALLSWLAYRKAAKNYERVDL